MPQRRKADDELTASGKYSREYNKRFPEKYELQKKNMKDRYNKNRLKIQLEKRERTKKKRLEYIELLGGMCAGCGERFNKHARISNLQFDHKQYFTGKTMPKSVLYQMDDLRKNGVDLNPYFILLCIDCHRIMTAVRKHRDKTMKMFDYISKNNMF